MRKRVREGPSPWAAMSMGRASCHWTRRQARPGEVGRRRGKARRRKTLTSPRSAGSCTIPCGRVLGYAGRGPMAGGRQRSAGIGEEERHEAPLRDQPADDQADREGEVDRPVDQARTPGAGRRAEPRSGPRPRSWPGGRDASRGGEEDKRAAASRDATRPICPHSRYRWAASGLRADRPAVQMEPALRGVSMGGDPGGRSHRPPTAQATDVAGTCRYDVRGRR